jgi:hypothetical protein
MYHSNGHLALWCARRCRVHGALRGLAPEQLKPSSVRAWIYLGGCPQPHSAAVGTETRRAIGSSEQAAASTTPSTFNTLKSPPSHAQTTPATPEQAPDSHLPSVQPRGSSRTHTPSRIEHNLNPQPGERVAHSGTQPLALRSACNALGLSRKT